MFIEIKPYEASYEVMNEPDQVEAIRMEIIDFLKWTVQFLADLRRSEFYFDSPALQSIFNLAFEEFVENELPLRILASINEANYYTLQDHGLTGHQLNAKLMNISYWSHETYDAVQMDYSRDGRSRVWRYLAKRMFAMLNSILGSLSQIIPITGALKEMKDLGENSMDIVREGHRKNRNGPQE